MNRHGAGVWWMYGRCTARSGETGEQVTERRWKQSEKPDATCNRGPREDVFFITISQLKPPSVSLTVDAPNAEKIALPDHFTLINFTV